MAREIFSEQELPEDPLLISAIYNTIGNLVVVLDKKGHIILYNQACQELTGLCAKQVKGQCYWDVFCLPEEVEIYKEFFLHLQVEDFPFEVETCQEDKKGENRIILWRNTVLLYQDGTIRYHILTGTDITLHRESKRAILEMGERYRALIHASPVAVISLDQNAEVVSWSSAAEQIFGWPEKEVLGHRITSFLDDKNGTMGYYLEAVLKRRSMDNIEMICNRKDALPVYVDVSLSPLFNYRGERSGMVLVAKDISDRIKVEEDLKQQLHFQKMVSRISSSFLHLSQDRVDQIMEQALLESSRFFLVDRSYLFWFSNQGNYQWCTDGVEKKEDIFRMGRSLLETSLGGKDYLYMSQRETSTSQINREKRFLQQGIASLLLIPMLEEGVVKGFLGYETLKEIKEWTLKEISFSRVISEIIFSAITKMQFEEALRTSEEYNRSIVEILPDSLVKYNRQGEYLDLITPCQHKFLPKGDLLGKRVTDILPKEEGIRFQRAIEGAITSNSLQVTDYSLQVSTGLQWFEARIIPLENQEVMALIRDITEKKQVEQKIQEYTNELEHKRKEMVALYSQLDDELNKARDIHESSLPRTLPQVEGISIAAYYQPAQEVGGDFYFVTKRGQKLIMYLADVTGHGLDGAMLSLFIKNTISSYLAMAKEEEITPASILQFLTFQYQRENYPKEYFLCIYLFTLDLETMNLSYLGAGFQDYPLYSFDDREQGELVNTGLPLSSIISQENMNMQEKCILFREGSTLFVTTDGLTEQLLGSEVYSSRLKEVFYQNSSYPPDVLVQMINDDFMGFNKSLQGEDDITFLVLQVEDSHQKKVQLQLESHFSALDHLHHQILTLFKDYQGKENLLMGLHELCVNAMEHGNQFHQDKKVKIQLKIAPHFLLATVEDEGEGFDWRKRMTYPLELDGYDERGRGLFLTGVFCKKLFYNDKGNKAFLLLDLDL